MTHASRPRYVEDFSKRVEGAFERLKYLEQCRDDALAQGDVERAAKYDRAYEGLTNGLEKLLLDTADNLP